MSTELVSLSDMERMAQAFAKSALFGTKTPEQCMALLLLAQAEGQHPAIAMRDFDVIQGRPSKKAEAMLRSFLQAGGKVEWHRLDDEGADATFSHPQGGSARITWDAARAKKAGLGGREMYGKYPRAMYRSRVVSEGCRTVYPASTSGMYVPEELRQILKDEKRQEKDMGRAEVVQDEDDDKLRALEQNAPPRSTADSPPPEASAPTSLAAGGATRSETLKHLCANAGVNVIDLLAKADVQIAEDMTAADWQSCVAMLNRKISKRAVAKAQEIAGQP
jgi:hypothetical protein